MAFSINFTSLKKGQKATNNNFVTEKLDYLDKSHGTPVGDGIGLTNSEFGEYPTAEALEFDFRTPVSNLSLLFGNEGNNSDFTTGGTSYTAYDHSREISHGNISSINNGSTVDIAGFGITRLVIDNGTLGQQVNNGGDWIFDVDSLKFNL